MLYSTIIPKQYEKTVYIHAEIYTKGRRLPLPGKNAAKTQENVGKGGFAVEFASNSCYFSSRKLHGKAESCAGSTCRSGNDTKNQRWNVACF